MRGSPVPTSSAVLGMSLTVRRPGRLPGGGPGHPIPAPPLPAGDKALDGYSKKKYVCKLLFIFLLGHDIDFGHMEAVNLLSSNRYTEKQIVSARQGAASHRGPWRFALALPLRLSGDFPAFGGG